MNVRRWFLGAIAGGLLVIGGFVSGPVASFAALLVQTVTQTAASPAASPGTSPSSSPNGSVTQPSPSTGDPCIHDNAA